MSRDRRAAEEAADPADQYPTVRAEIAENDDPMRTPLARATCPHCEKDVAHGLPVNPGRFTVGCRECGEVFNIDLPEEAFERLGWANVGQ
jgi:hypothetical protein